MPIAKVVDDDYRRGEASHGEGMQERREEHMPHHRRGGVDEEARLGRRRCRRHHRPGQAEVGNAHRRDDAEVREDEDVAEAGVSDGNVPEPDVPQGERTAGVGHGVEHRGQDHGDHDGIVAVPTPPPPTPEVETETDVIGGAGGGAARDIAGGGDQRDQVTDAHVRGRAQAQYASSTSLVGGEPSPLGGTGLADALVRVGPLREIGVIVVKIRRYLYQACKGRELDRRNQR